MGSWVKGNDRWVRWGVNSRKGWDNVWTEERGDLRGERKGEGVWGVRRCDKRWNKIVVFSLATWINSWALNRWNSIPCKWRWRNDAIRLHNITKEIHHSCYNIKMNHQAKRSLQFHFPRSGYTQQHQTQKPTNLKIFFEYHSWFIIQYSRTKKKGKKKRKKEGAYIRNH